MSKQNPKLRTLLDVLFALGKGRKSFSELKTLYLSPSTVLSRLRESEEKGWVKGELAQSKGKKPKIKYSLTDEGRKVVTTYDSVIPQYHVLKEELEKLQEEVKGKEREMRILLTSVKQRETRPN